MHQLDVWLDGYDKFNAEQTQSYSLYTIKKDEINTPTIRGGAPTFRVVAYTTRKVRILSLAYIRASLKSLFFHGFDKIQATLNALIIVPVAISSDKPMCIAHLRQYHDLWKKHGSAAC
jgi:hypothetical protein